MRIILPMIVLLIGMMTRCAERRSAACSLKTLFQVAMIFLLMTSAVAAIWLGILGGPSLAFRVSALILTIPAALLSISGFAVLVYRVADGRPVRVHANAPLCNRHRRQLTPWIRTTVVLTVAVGVCALLVPRQWMVLPLSVGVLLLLLALSVLYPLYLQARRFDLGMTALLERPWVHWSYTAEQWQTWAAIRRSWERAAAPLFRWKRDWMALILPILLMAAATWFVADGSLVEKAGIFGGSVLVLLASASIITWAARGEPDRRYRRMLSSRAEAYLGPDGLYCSGEYSPWAFSDQCLVEAAAVHAPLRLLLTFDVAKGNGAAALARLIPIPEGSEGDLDKLQRELGAVCPDAAVSLTPRERYIEASTR